MSKRHKVFTLFVLLTLVLPSMTWAEDAISPKKECVRVLTATCERFVTDAKVPSGSRKLSLAKQILTNELTTLHAEERVPRFGELRRIRRWLDRYHEKALASGLYPKGSQREVQFTLKLSLAVSYVEAAMHIAKLRQGR